ncbi:MAG: ethylbenzene dehydrogenase-related protein [Endomicrobiia bacterium]
MNKTKLIVILVSIVLISGFSFLVWYGLRHSRGVPVVIEKTERKILEVMYIQKDIDLTKDFSYDVWDKIPSLNLNLMYQVTVLPWPKTRPKVSSVSVKAFHNKRNIYFYLKWEDSTEDRIIGTNKFSDACAIMFPLTEITQPATIMMGFLGKVNIWHWKASKDREYWLKQLSDTKVYADFYYPFEEKETFPISREISGSAVNDLVAIRVGTITPKETQNVQGRGYFIDGSWNVIFKRSFNPVDPEFDAEFKIGKEKLCAFAVWDGSSGDRGGRKSISDWVILRIK